MESVLGVPYARPYSKMTEYLDALDLAEPPVPAGERMLAALGPRMLALARARASAVHPYLVPPEHTAATRQALGPGIVLAPEQAVAARVRGHHEAGADHVCIYVFGSGPGSGPGSGSGFGGETFPLDAWRRLAPVLTGR